MILVTGCKLQIRFVKWPLENKCAALQSTRSISSTKVRATLQSYPQKTDAIGKMVLSPDVLLKEWVSWFKAAKRGLGEHVAFPADRGEGEDCDGQTVETPAEMLLTLKSPWPWGSMVVEIDFVSERETFGWCEAVESLRRWHSGSIPSNENEKPSRKRLKRSSSVDFDIGVRAQSWLPVPVREMGFCCEAP